LQSKEYEDRILNLNSGLKLIKYSTREQPIITLDRSINDEVVLNLGNADLINVVCGSYLRDDIKERYKILKKYLNEKDK